LAQEVHQKLLLALHKKSIDTHHGVTEDEQYRRADVKRSLDGHLCAFEQRKSKERHKNGDDERVHQEATTNSGFSALFKQLA
jgi:hypothetical protein